MTAGFDCFASQVTNIINTKTNLFMSILGATQIYIEFWGKTFEKEREFLVNKHWKPENRFFNKDDTW